MLTGDAGEVSPLDACIVVRTGFDGERASRTERNPQAVAVNQFANPGTAPDS